MRQQQARRRLAMRGVVHGEIGGGIDQHLTGEFRACLAHGNGCDGREIAAGAVAADEKSRRIDAELLRIRGHPFRCGNGVLGCGGEFVLRCQAIVDGDDDQLTLMCELAARHVVGVEIADHKAAAVEKDEAGRQASRLAQPLRRVDACRDRAVRGGDRERRCRLELRRFGIGGKARGHVHLARFGRRPVLVGRAFRLQERLVDGCGIRIENDRHSRTSH